MTSAMPHSLQRPEAAVLRTTSGQPDKALCDQVIAVLRSLSRRTFLEPDRKSRPIHVTADTEHDVFLASCSTACRCRRNSAFQYLNTKYTSDYLLSVEFVP
jgi:hypothetical protein